MSIFTGYRDVLLRKCDDNFKLYALSPAGHKWIENNIAYGYKGFEQDYVGELVAILASQGLSVEVR